MSEQKDNTTFEHAYHNFYKCIYQFIFSMLGNPDEAEDKVQETFMKLYHYLSDHPPLENTRTWLYRVASNICLNHLKRQKIFQKILTTNLHRQHHIRQNPVEENLIEEQERTMVKNALNKFPARERALLMLYRDKFSYADMAAILNIKKTSVGKILSRAREKLVREIRKGETNEMHQ